MSDDLETRVRQFETLALPGQPKMMHMGTSYLVGDLWAEVQRLRGVLTVVVKHAAPGTTAHAAAAAGLCRPRPTEENSDV